MKIINRIIQLCILIGIPLTSSSQWQDFGNNLILSEWLGADGASTIPVSFEHQANSAISRFEWSTTNGTLQERMRLTQLGFLGLNTVSPLSMFHMVDGGMTVSGTTGANPNLGAGTRMMWIPSLAAFRAGTISGTQWNDPNVGIGSMALGRNVQASGIDALALGTLNNSIGQSSFTLGSQNITDNIGCGAIGNDVHTIGSYSIALGRHIKFTAEGSITIGTGSNLPVVDLVNPFPNSFLIGMNSNIPTFFISPSAGSGTFGRVGIGNITTPTHL